MLRAFREHDIRPCLSLDGCWEFVTAADRTQSLADSISHMDGTMETTVGTADQVLERANTVAKEVDRLKLVVDSFLSKVKAA